MKTAGSSFIKPVVLLIGVTFSFLQVTAQQPLGNTDKKTSSVTAGSQYRASNFHQWLWGKHYRKEWTTPVAVTNLYLDTAFGGLTPYKADAGLQTKTLRLRSADNNEYILRSIDKSYEQTIPKIYRNTFIEHIVTDQVPGMHPYSAVTIPAIAEAAGVYHTSPKIRFVPKQPALGKFNEEYGDKLYILEERPAGNWEESENLGNPARLISTDELLKRLKQSHRHRVDQQQYIRSRVLDILIGDWSRAEDQWRWSATQMGDTILYEPIPRDRDQAYSKYDGVLLRIGLSAAGLSHIETFRGRIDDITTFNHSARNLDRRIANETGEQVWLNAADHIQRSVTDAVIESSIKALPPEVYKISGPRLIQILKFRRDQLKPVVKDYYRFIAKEIDIPATSEREHFNITRVNQSDVNVRIFHIDSLGNRMPVPFYDRVFHERETKEIRLYGISGMDSYEINGSVKNDIDVVIIGGPDRDSIIDRSGAKNETHIYDDRDNAIIPASRTRLHLTNDDDVHHYRYDGFYHDKKGFKPVAFFNNSDRFYVGLGYEITRQGWRKDPFAYRHGLYARYSFTQNAFALEYEGILNQFLGKWDILLNADYDAIRWTNYFGTGNESVDNGSVIDYYRVYSRELFGSVSLNRRLGRRGSYVRLTPFYQGTKVLHKDGKYLTDGMGGATNGDPQVTYQRDDFIGLTFSYLIAKVDDPVVTRKGYTWTSALSYIKSLESRREVKSVSSALNFYIPLTRQFIFASRNGVGAVDGDPMFYQLPAIGGSNNLRGYRRDRFRARTAFFSNNELQWLFDVKSHLFNGAAGPVVFYDIGRVWQPGETSNKWHKGYGAGILVAPFNRAMIFLGAGISEENKVIHLRLTKAF